MKTLRAVLAGWILLVPALALAQAPDAGAAVAEGGAAVPDGGVPAPGTVPDDGVAPRVDVDAPPEPAPEGELAASERGFYVDLGVPVGILAGDTTYHISAYDGSGGVESELEFPLESPLFGVRAEVGSRRPLEYGRFVVEGSFMSNAGAGAGTMRDSDWLSGAYELGGVAHPGKDVYSESDANLSATALQARLRYERRVGAGVVLGASGGFRHERYEYEVRNVHQVGYGPYAGDMDFDKAGRVLDYRITYQLLEAGAHGTFDLGRRVRAGVDLSFAPWVSAQDHDDHLLRGKIAEGDAVGTAYGAAASLRWSMSDADALQVQGSVMRVETSGTQVQTWYAHVTPDDPEVGTRYSVDVDITSTRASLLVLYSHRL
jgi:outer membrane protease